MKERKEPEMEENTPTKSAFHCRECGAPLAKSGPFCPNCGALNMNFNPMSVVRVIYGPPPKDLQPHKDTEKKAVKRDEDD